MENINVNVSVNDCDTTVTINVHILKLCSALGMTGMTELLDDYQECRTSPTPQSLIDDAELSGYVHEGNVSSWVTSLIATEALREINKLKNHKRLS